MRHGIFVGTGVLAAAFGLTGAMQAQLGAVPDESTTHTVFGTVAYRQRIALPPNAVVRVKIEDVSRADAPAISIANEQIETKGRQVPIAFDVKYDPSVINPAHRYQIRATITAKEDGVERTLFTSTTAYPVLTQNAPSKVDMLLEQLPAVPPDSGAAKPLTGTHWTLVELDGHAIPSPSGQRHAYIELQKAGGRVSGSGGCNRIMGSYVLDGMSLHFEQMASTMMACPGDPITNEQAFLKALGATTNYRIHGSSLLLRGPDKDVLARLEAQVAEKADGEK
jgi:putative lipoprotein